MTNSIEQIKISISKGEIKLALKNASIFFQGDYKKDEITLLEGQFSELQKKKNLNLILDEIYNKEIARISYSLIEILNAEQTPIKLKNKDLLSTENLGEAVKQFKDSSTGILNKSEEEIRKHYAYKLELYKEMFASFENEIKEEYPNILFERIINSDNLEEIEINSISRFSLSYDVKWFNKCLIVSALTIRLISKFDIYRFELLVNFLSSFEDKVWQRAFVGVILASLNKAEKIKGYPHVINKLSKLKELKMVAEGVKHIDDIFRTKEFHYNDSEIEKATEKFQHQVSMIAQNQNVSWEEAMTLMIRNWMSKGIENFENEFSRSILLGFFKRHKDYQFFSKPQHWFLPFYSENVFVQKAMEKCQKNINTKKFAQALEFSFSVCNSDKYSLCFAIDEYSDFQARMCLEIFEQEKIQLDSLFESDEKEKKGEYLHVFNSYFQDLYTFYKHYPKNKFKNFFESLNQIYDVDIIDIILKKIQKDEIIADVEYEKNNFSKALNIYLDIEKINPDNIDVLKKIAHCYVQGEKDFNRAIYYHDKIINIAPNDFWNLINLCKCHISLNNLEEAEKLLSKAKLINPDDSDLLWYYAQYHVKREEYEKALKYDIERYNKSPGFYELNSIGVRLFQIGDLEKAYQVFKQCENSEIDYMAKGNLGYVHLIKDNEELAINYFTICSEKLGLDSMLDAIDSSAKLLRKYGITDEKIVEIKKKLNKVKKHDR